MVLEVLFKVIKNYTVQYVIHFRPISVLQSVYLHPPFSTSDIGNNSDGLLRVNSNKQMNTVRDHSFPWQIFSNSAAHSPRQIFHIQ